MNSPGPHPAEAAIRRVLAGEVAVAHGEMATKDDYMKNYDLCFSDGWRVIVFPDGWCFRDWDYIEEMVSPDGERYVAEDGLPRATWMYSPSREERDRWGLLPE